MSPPTPRLGVYVQHTMRPSARLRAYVRKWVDQLVVRPRGLEPLASCSGGLSSPVLPKNKNWRDYGKNSPNPYQDAIFPLSAVLPSIIA